MVDGKFDIVFAGRTVPGKTPEEVQQNLAKLFKTGESQIKRLFVGAEVAIKKGLDYNQAMKYQSALKQAGALVLIKPVQEGANTSTDSSQSQPETHPASQTSDSDTRSAVPDTPQQPATSSHGRASFGPKEPEPVSHGRASFGPKEQEPVSQGRASFGPKEPDTDSSDTEVNKTTAKPTEESQSATPAVKEGSSSDDDWSLANAGERLPEVEKQAPMAEPDLSDLALANSGEPLQKVSKKEQREVDTSDLSLDEPGLIQEPKPFEAKQVDTSELSVADVGEKIPTEQKKKETVNPNIDHLKVE